MLDSTSWIRLIDGLSRATRQGELKWSEVDTSQGLRGSALFMATVNRHIMGGRLYRATTPTGLFELSAADEFGNPPHELIVWETKRESSEPVGTLRSDTNVMAREVILANRSLASLCATVAASIEPPDKIVDRLLGGLGLES